jgi:hypothetical protein
LQCDHPQSEQPCGSGPDSSVEQPPSHGGTIRRGDSRSQASAQSLPLAGTAHSGKLVELIWRVACPE